MKFSLKSVIATAVAAVCLAGTAAHADVTTANIRPGSIAGLFSDGSDPQVIDAGLSITNSGNANSLLDGSFFGFCIEPVVGLSAAVGGAGDSTYTAAFAAMTPMVQRLFDLGFGTAATNDNTALAFTLALQELISETSGTLSLASGTFVRNGATGYEQGAATAANTLLQLVLGNTVATNHYDLVRFSSPSSQDLLSAINAPSNNVPEPSGLALMAAALVAAGAVARRRNQA